MRTFRRVLCFSLGFIILFACFSLFFACENKAILGTYKDTSGCIFLELKTKGKCEFYYLQRQGDGTLESKENLFEGHNLFYGTFVVDGKNITLYYAATNSGRPEEESSTGKIHSNGNIILDMLFAVSNISLRKQ